MELEGVVTGEEEKEDKGECISWKDSCKVDNGNETVPFLSFFFDVFRGDERARW